MTRKGFARYFQSGLGLKLVIASCIAVLLLSSAFIIARHKPDIERLQQDASELAAEIASELPLHHKDLAAFIRSHESELISYLDVNATISIVLDGLQKGWLNMYDCHGLTHDIGHHAAIYHLDHLQDHVALQNLNACGSGFVHGVEDGLASGETSGFRNKLYWFCIASQPVTRDYYGCYHGAGHAFMRENSDPDKALALCSSLIVDVKVGADADLCYRGVFSQYLATLKIKGSSNLAQARFCASQKKPLRDLCAMELVGGLTPSSTERDAADALASCTAYPSIELSCLKSMSWEAATALLATRDTVTPPYFISQLSENAKHMYIAGTIDAIQRMQRNGVNARSEPFCESFPGQKDRQACDEYARERM